MPLEYQQSFWKAVLDLNEKFKITILLATNNPEEAFSLDVRTVILRNGYIQQIDNVANLQEKPANLYVAQFVNDMNMTTLEGVLEQGDDGTVKLIIDKGAIKVDISAAEDNKRLKNYIGRDVTAGIRHDFLKIAKNDELGIKGKIEQVSADADKNTALFKSKLFDAWICVGADVKEGDKISLEVNENAVFVFDRDTGKTIT